MTTWIRYLVLLIRSLPWHPYVARVLVVMFFNYVAVGIAYPAMEMSMITWLLYVIWGVVIIAYTLRWVCWHNDHVMLMIVQPVVYDIYVSR